MICPLCLTTLQNPWDDFFYLCKVCDALVKNSKFYLTPEQEKKRYEKHQNDVHDVGYQSFTFPLTKIILENQKPNHLGLDYGCGKASVVTYQLLQNNYQVKCYDPYFFPDEAYLNFFYDYIFCCEVFEHFQQPKHEIEKLLKILVPNGRLYVMTHLYHSDIPFENWYYRRDPTHVFIYTEKTMRFIAKKYLLHLEHLSERIVIFKKC